mmetsp:Transcript_14245/g.31107  ORF Transcript_14245/g.31107 Transcript_14245/m.31107 type:complete len:225 (+) Transcript_14245:972-1646(+)
MYRRAYFWMVMAGSSNPFSKRLASKNSKAPARKYVLVFPTTNALTTLPFLSTVSFSFSACVKMASISALALPGSFDGVALGSHCDENRKRTTEFSIRLGNAERDSVTAATTPAQRNCSTVGMCSIKTGTFFMLGLIQRMYRDCVLRRFVMRLSNCVLYLPQTVGATKLDLARLGGPLGLSFLGSSILAAMTKLFEVAHKSPKSMGSKSWLLATNWSASYMTLPA